MTGPILGTGYAPGLGKVLITEGDRTDYLRVRVIKTGIEYYRRRKDVQFEKAGAAKS